MGEAKGILNQTSRTNSRPSCTNSRTAERTRASRFARLCSFVSKQKWIFFFGKLYEIFAEPINSKDITFFSACKGSFSKQILHAMFLNVNKRINLFSFSEIKFLKPRATMARTKGGGQWHRDPP